MADRLTNVEIEDILSSIRRLVSEEARPPLVRQPPKLVLTEAERVDIAPHAPPAEDVLEARISELEALLGVPGDEFEADEGDPFPSPFAAPGAARVQPEPLPEPPAAAEPTSAPPQPEPDPAVSIAAEPAGEAEEWVDAPPLAGDAGDDATDVIDEEVLRDLVRDILREELQGALGERITRNVRKLVRAEIARALSSRDL